MRLLDIGNIAEVGSTRSRLLKALMSLAVDAAGDRMADIALLMRLIEPEAQALGLSLVRVAMFGGKSDPTLQIMAERPDTRQLDLSDCEALSRRVSEILDTEDPIEEAYRLEVSSPGIDRPLTRRPDYDDFKGFDARIRLAVPLDGRKVFEGRLDGLEGDHVKLNAVRVGEVLIPLPSIANAKLLLTDALIKATAPLSTEGADSIITDAPPAAANDISKEG